MIRPSVGVVSRAFRDLSPRLRALRSLRALRALKPFGSSRVTCWHVRRSTICDLDRGDWSDGLHRRRYMADLLGLQSEAAGAGGTPADDRTGDCPAAGRGKGLARR